MLPFLGGPRGPSYPWGKSFGRRLTPIAPPNYPVNSVAPVVTGTAAQGATLTCSAGTWSNSPTGYAYQWLQDGVTIVGATSSTYSPAAGDVAHNISCRVTATNANGTGNATSVSVGPITVPSGPDVSKLFATSFYNSPGTGSSVTVSTPFDPDLVINKIRAGGGSNTILYDRVRGPGLALVANGTFAENNFGAGYATVGTGGYQDAGFGAASGAVGWAFAQDPRFFKIITYTGNGTTQVIPHGLDPSVSVGMVIIKRRDGAGDWMTWHRSLGSGKRMFLQTTSAAVGPDAFSKTVFGDNVSTINPSNSGVTIGSDSTVNVAGGLYEMLVFAHDTASDGVVQCGSVAAGSTATLNWRPQFLLIKEASATGNWVMLDTVRGWGVGNDPYLAANSPSAEINAGDFGAPTNTGFTTVAAAFGTTSDTLIYAAIRAPGG